MKASIESRPDQRNCDEYPLLEADAIFKQIELEGWRLAQPLHLFEFFQNLFIWSFYMRQKTPNRIGNQTKPNQTVKASIESCLDQSDCDAYPHLEAVTISKRIELEGWRLSKPL
jgi:hypothetical protein